MYSKDEVSKLKTQFWTSFGQYMKPVPGASGLPANWINYKTGIRHIHFKMDADNTRAVITIEISSPKGKKSGSKKMNRIFFIWFFMEFIISPGLYWLQL